MARKKEARRFELASREYRFSARKAMEFYLTPILFYKERTKERKDFFPLIYRILPAAAIAIAGGTILFANTKPKQSILIQSWGNAKNLSSLRFLLVKKKVSL